MQVQVKRPAFRDELRGFPPRILWTLTFALFIALKLADVTDWSWGWVLAPIWIPVLLALVIVALVAIAFTLFRWLLMARAWLHFRHALTPEPRPRRPRDPVPDRGRAPRRRDAPGHGGLSVPRRRTPGNKAARRP